jgi:hypothetical protein
MIPAEESFAEWHKDPEYVKPTMRSKKNSCSPRRMFA